MLNQDDAGARYVHDWPEKLFDFVPPGSRVLDVGCSRGAFGETLKEKRPSTVVFGIEPTDAAAYAEQVLDRVLHGRYPEDLPEDWEPFDVITFFDVLEHMFDPWSALRRTTDALKPGGVVIALLPNVRCVSVSVRLLFKGEWRYENRGILDRTHVRFFTRSSIEELFSASGFQLLQLTPWNKELVNTRVARILKALGSRCDDLTSLQFLAIAQKCTP